VTNAAAERIATTEHSFGPGKIAIGHRASDRARGNRNAIECDGLDDIDREIVLLAKLAKHVDVAASATAKAMIVSNDELTQAETLEQDALDELRSVEGRERWREWNYDDVLQTAFGHGLQFFLCRREQRRSGRWVDDLERMGIERDEEARKRASGGAGGDPREQIAVTEMDTVEGADGDDRAKRQPRQCRSNSANVKHVA